MRPRASTSKRCDEHIEALWRVHRRAVASTSKRCEPPEWSHIEALWRAHRSAVNRITIMESFTPPEWSHSLALA